MIQRSCRKFELLQCFFIQRYILLIIGFTGYMPQNLATGKTSMLLCKNILEIAEKAYHKSEVFVFVSTEKH